MGEIFSPTESLDIKKKKKVSFIECEGMIEYIYAKSLNIRTYMYSSKEEKIAALVYANLFGGINQSGFTFETFIRVTNILNGNV